MGTLHLLVAGGNEITRKGICALVREQPDWDLAAEARDGREAVEKTKKIKPHIAIMDIDNYTITFSLICGFSNIPSRRERRLSEIGSNRLRIAAVYDVK